MSHSRYKTYQICVKRGHPLFSYFQHSCLNAKNLYNTTNFYIRQVFTALRQEGPLQPLQQEVLDTLEHYMPAMNGRQYQAWQSRMKREQQKPAANRREVKLHLFEMPTKEQPYLSYSLLDSLFKIMAQPDYRTLPTQSSQWVLKNVFQNWKSFFMSLQDYRQHPAKYQARPRIPKYCQAQEKEVIFTNQDCTIKEGRCLKFPKTTVRLSIGKLGASQGKLKQVRVIPKYGQYMVELVMAYSETQIEAGDKERYMAIDLGIDNLATIVTTTGSQPIVVKGKHIKSINQYYNKKKAHYTRILRHGQTPSQGPYTTKRLERLHRNRHHKIKDQFHKASFQIVQHALAQGAGTIIIGRTKGWKQKANIGKRNNQSFCTIPHQLLVAMIKYKAEERGIDVLVTEEAYTSKASFLDLDPLPVYEKDRKFTFTGKRIHRGLYRSAQEYINADVNGAANILRKVVPTATAYGIEGLDGTQSVNVSTPLVLSIW